MMNMSSSQHVIAHTPFLANAFLYRDVAVSVLDHEPEQIAQPDTEKLPAEATCTASEIAQMLAAARAEAAAETEVRLKTGMEATAAEHAKMIAVALDRFTEERKSYFSRVESDVVHLALAIAAKILHREAVVDPMLIAALVRVAVNKLHDGSTVTVRVAPSEVERWAAFLANPLNGSTVKVVEDMHLAIGECVLETDLGSANFSIDAQLKEVEQGFFDLLAQRPAVK
jgi:flagellar biosynthesis/type III secretory pathway protein FliH